MSVRLGLLATLGGGAMHAYELRQEFERRTSGAWPLNMGQVVTSLASLAKAGLVEELEAQTPRGATRWTITPAGRERVAQWWAAPVPRDVPDRDEAAIKVALAVTDPAVDAESVIQVQRAAVIVAMQELTRLSSTGQDDGGGDLAWEITLNRLIFAGEAEVRWLDHTEMWLRRTGRLTTPVDGDSKPSQGSVNAIGHRARQAKRTDRNAPSPETASPVLPSEPEHQESAR
ncbi:MAG: PadR family transcriptional regulator [Bifidobacteriaceae bacterium]|jgi:DNA-binding PadR family transcriptional regulator|nr:PadR family transcriptional regulator [Bifidobacteriaceae bacterium]